MALVRRYLTRNRFLVLLAAFGIALLGYIYVFRVTHAYNARCMVKGETEGDPLTNGLFFFPLLLPMALIVRSTSSLIVLRMILIALAIVELPMVIIPPDIGIGCFGMGGDHDDQTKSLEAWILFTALFCLLAYGAIALEWLWFAVGIATKEISHRLNQRRP